MTHTPNTPQTHTPNTHHTGTAQNKTAQRNIYTTRLPLHSLTQKQTEECVYNVQISVELIHKGLLAHNVVAIGRRTLQMPQHLGGKWTSMRMRKYEKINQLKKRKERFRFCCHAFLNIVVLLFFFTYIVRILLDGDNGAVGESLRKRHIKNARSRRK